MKGAFTTVLTRDPSGNIVVDTGDNIKHMTVRSHASIGFVKQASRWLWAGSNGGFTNSRSVALK